MQDIETLHKHFRAELTTASRAYFLWKSRCIVIIGRPLRQRFENRPQELVEIECRSIGRAAKAHDHRLS